MAMTLADLSPEVLQRMGLVSRAGDDGSSHFFDAATMNRVNDTSIYNDAVNDYGSLDPQGRLAYGSGGPLKFGGNRFFGGDVDLNGSKYSQIQHPYDTFAGNPQYAEFLRQAGVTPQDFSYNDQYGNLLANNDRTAAYRTMLGQYITQQNEGGLADRITSQGPIILGTAALGPMLGPALAGATGLSEGVSSALIKAAVSGIAGGGPIGALTSLATSGLTSAAGDFLGDVLPSGTPDGGGAPTTVADAAGATGTATDAAPAAAGSVQLSQSGPVSTLSHELLHINGGFGDALSAGSGIASSGLGQTGSGTGSEADPTIMPTTEVTASPLQADGEAPTPSAMTPERALDITGLSGTTPDLAPASGETGAFDSGQFSLADVGLQADTGAFDSGMFTPSDVGLGGGDTSSPLSNVSFPGGGGGSLDNGGDSSSSVDSRAFYEEAPDSSSEPFDMQKALNMALKFGPPLLGTASALQSRNSNQKFAQQIAQIGGPQRTVGQQLLNDFQAGKLNAADASRIASWEQSAQAQARQYFARAGASTGTSANATYRDISAKAEQMKQQALQGMLTEGINALNVTDKYQAQAIQAEMQADAAARTQALQFLNAYGSWLRVLPQITGGA